MRQPTIVNQPPTNLPLQPVEDDDQDAKRLGEIMALIPRFSSEYLARLHRGDVPTNKLDIIVDGNIYDLHSIAQQHGCTPSDVALEQRTKPFYKTLSPSKLRRNFCPKCFYTTQDHECPPPPADAHLENWSYHINATALRNAQKLLVADERRREQERLQRFSGFTKTTPAARRATWGKSFGADFANMMRCATSVTDRVVIRDLTTLNVAHSLESHRNDATVIPRTCFFHDRVRAFTFSDGTTIKMCPDCTSFDEQRRNVLKTGTRAQAKMQHAWEERLKAEGFAVVPLLSRKQTALERIESKRAGDEGKASPERNDDRANRIRNEVKTNTEAQRNCIGCGQLFVPTHARQKHCSDNCRKRHHKQLKRSERNGDRTTQSTINRSTNHEQ